jgi:DNA-binding transcriptional ArsR family regulator
MDQMREAAIFKALANPVRLCLLEKVSGKDYSTSELHRALGIAAATLSQHLAILKAAGLVRLRRNGRQVYAMLATPEIALIRKWMRGMLQRQCHDLQRALETQPSATPCSATKAPDAV